MPGTLQAADATIKKLEDFMSTMDANGERIRGLLEAGRQLVSEGNIHAEKIREKADSIEKRYDEGSRQVRGPRGKQVETAWPQRWRVAGSPADGGGELTKNRGARAQWSGGLSHGRGRSAPPPPG